MNSPRKGEKAGVEGSPVSDCQTYEAKVLKSTSGLMQPHSSKTGAPSSQKRKPPPPFQLTDSLMPPCSPSITFSRRGMQWVFACSPISMPM